MTKNNCIQLILERTKKKADKEGKKLTDESLLKFFREEVKEHDLLPVEAMLLAAALAAHTWEYSRQLEKAIEADNEKSNVNKGNCLALTATFMEIIDEEMNSEESLGVVIDINEENR